ncbi:hypothetical protein SCP_0300900 [Sparassis crispa]|uniref:Uncharacterized protein n=1 Tax=Sparassis crispa TaxID=139825 RepID=A0A401GE26_9APHY|nr:hypothetical protein SCP_0300900 [Sparassis crispa]GBE80375.1 hypothetical protein SCP_0300900 [Sparassis crispa]
MLLALARSMIYTKDLPCYLWAEAVSHAAYIKNRAPTSVLNHATPEEKWNQSKPNISHLREFGSIVWVLTEDIALSKLAPRANKYIFVGYVDGPNAIKYYDAKMHQIKMTQNYHFTNRDPSPNNTTLQPREREGPDAPQSRTADMQREGESSDSGGDALQSSVNNPLKCRREEDEDRDAPNKNKPRCSKRVTVRPDYRLLNDSDTDAKDNADADTEDNDSALIADLIYVAMSEENMEANEPKSLNDAKNSSEWPKWETAVQAELEQLDNMGTWELVDLPQGRTPVGNKWVLVKKTNREGEVIKFKARLVTKGYSQIPRMDYTETYSPVVCLETIRAILGLAAILNWDIQQMNVKGAYLNGILKEEIYMRQPKGFSNGTHRVCRMRKTLYGLKQAGHEWNIILNHKLLDAGFRQLFADPCAYIRTKNGKTEIIAVWVDDLLLFTNDHDLMDHLKKELQSMFEVTDLGEPKKIVGIEIERNREKKTIKVSQNKYIDSILRRHGLENANPVGMPLDPNVTLEKDEDDTNEVPNRDSGYASLIGSLMYAAVAT